MSLLVILVPAFVIGLDTFVVNIALPVIQRQLDASPAQVQIVNAGFSLAYGAGLVTAGRLGDLYGRRRLFALGLTVFVLASAACGCAPDGGVLAGARVAQGLGAAVLAPQGLALLNTLFAGAQRVRAMHAYAAVIGVSAVTGQLAGGLLVELDLAGLGWRAIFLLNVPIGVAALVLARRLPATKPMAGSGLDLWGAVLVTTAATALVFPMIVGREQGWPPWTWFGPVVAAALAAVFARHQRRLAARGGDPLIQPDLLRDRVFGAGLGLVVAFHAAVAALFMTFPYWLQQGQSMSVVDSSLFFLPLSAGYLAAAALSDRLTRRLGNHTLTAGCLAMAAGAAPLAALAMADIATAAYVCWLVACLLVLGFGMGTVLAPLVALVLAGIPAGGAATAGGALSTAMQVGNAIGVALVGTVFFGLLGGRTGATAYREAFAGSMYLMVVLALMSALLVRLLRRPAG